jgi:rhomboid protease GluP
MELMSVTDPPAGVTEDDALSGLVEAGIYATAADGFEHGLVVLAMGEAYWLVRTGSGYRLLVEPRALAVARVQLTYFDRDSVGWPPPPVVDRPASRKTDRLTPLVWVVVELTAYAIQIRSPEAWEKAGALDSQAVFDRGEWWRVATALFLHADLGHVLANVGAGFFVFSSLTSTIGRMRGWLLLGLAACVGNFAAAALNYPGPYESIGASTAVFAGLGLLTGRAVRALHGNSGQRRWRTVLAPLAAGVTLLGLFGSGGLRTDVVAHLTGFGAGLGLGFGAETSSSN